MLTHRGGGDPQQRRARKWSAGLRPASRGGRNPPDLPERKAPEWSAGLRPASRPERAAKPRYPKRRAANPPGSLPSVSRGANAPQRRRSPPAKSAGMERRSPTGIAAREGRETALSPRGGQQTLRVRCHQFLRGANAPQRRRSPAAKSAGWSAGLRPASTADRRSKPPKPAGAESAGMERRSPTGIAAREGRETALSPRGGQQTLRVRCHQFPRDADAPRRRRSPPAKSAEMERRSPTGIDRREAVETPQTCRSRKRGNGAPASRNPPDPPEHKRGNGAPVSDRHRPPTGGRNPPDPPEHKRDNGAPVSDRHRGPRGPRNRAIPIPLTKRTTTASLARARKDLLSRDCSGCRRPPGSGVFRPG